MMKAAFSVLLVFSLFCCTPKGPQTFPSPYIGKTKTDIINAEGEPTEVRLYKGSEVYVYKKRKEFFGTSVPENKDVSLVPQKVEEVEKIYYINAEGIIYKYQVWKKRID